MNICLVNHRLDKEDGQARVNYELAKGMIERRFRLTLVASSVAPELLSAPGVSWIPVPVGMWPTQFVKNQAFALISALKLASRTREYDLVIVNGFITWARSDINAVHFVHGAWRRSPAHPFRLKKDAFGWYQYAFTSVNAVLEKVAFAKARYTVPVSEKVRREMAAGGFGGEARVIPNGVDIREFCPRPGDWRSRFGLPGDAPVALFAGDIRSPRKNLDSVLLALQSTGRVHLAVAGRTEGSPYPRMAERLGLRDRVHFLGFRRDMPELMNAADFFVFPSRYEACTLSVIEALASGLPVITTPESGVSELVTGAETAGIVLDHPEDVAGLARAMGRLAEDAAERMAMGRRARAVAERQSWESVADRYIALCEEALAAKRRPEAASRAHEDHRDKGRVS